MKQSLLDSLYGLSIDEATVLASKQGHIVCIYNSNTIIPAVTQPNTVVLFREDELVVDVQAGDPLEIENDLSTESEPSNFLAKTLTICVLIAMVALMVGVLWPNVTP